MLVLSTLLPCDDTSEAEPLGLLQQIGDVEGTWGLVEMEKSCSRLLVSHARVPDALFEQCRGHTMCGPTEDLGSGETGGPHPWTAVDLPRHYPR